MQTTPAQSIHQDYLEKIDFVMLAATSLHRYGASADRIEVASKIMSQSLGLKADFFATPTALFGSFKNEDLTEFTRLERVDPGRINLDKYSLVDGTIDDVLANKLTLAQGRTAIKQTLAKKSLYGSLLVNLSYALIGASIAIFLSGTLIDCLASCLLGLMVGVFSENIRIERIDSISESVAAFMVVSTVLVMLYAGIKINPTIIILASLIVLIPGLSMTTALMELASQNLTSGTARLMGSIIGLLKLSFGGYIATKFGASFGIELTAEQVTHYPIWVKSIALFFASVGLIISSQAQVKDGPWIILCCFISFWSASIGIEYFGQPAGSFMAGCILAIFCNYLSIKLARPTLIFLLPALILLVPGSIGYKSLNFLYSNDVLSGLDKGFAALAIGVALASGVFFGNVIVKPRRSL